MANTPNRSDIRTASENVSSPEFLSSSELCYFIYSVEAASIVEPPTLVEEGDAYIAEMFQHEYDKLRCNSYCKEVDEEEEEVEGINDSEITMFEDDLCVGVRRRALYEPPMPGRRNDRKRSFHGENVITATNIYEEDTLRGFISRANNNIEILNRHSDVGERRATNILSTYDGENVDDDEYAFYSLRSAFTMRSVLGQGATVINTVDDGPPKISIPERAKQWLKSFVLDYLPTNKWKVLIFGVVSTVVIVYFTVRNLSKEEVEGPLVNGQEAAYYTGAVLLATQKFNRTDIPEILSGDEVILFERSVEDWLSYGNVYSEQSTKESNSIMTECNVISQSTRSINNNLHRELDVFPSNNTFGVVFILSIEYTISYLIRSERDFGNFAEKVNDVMDKIDRRHEFAMILNDRNIKVDEGGVGEGSSFLLEEPSQISSRIPTSIPVSGEKNLVYIYIYIPFISTQSFASDVTQ